jgi:hypothetical protein
MELSKDREWLKRMAEEEKASGSPNILPSVACRFCSHAPCICDEYLVAFEEAEKWWSAFADGAKSINPADLRRLVVTVVSLHQQIKAMGAQTMESAISEMSEYCRQIRINAERIATARKCAQTARRIAEASKNFDEENACLLVAQAITHEFGLEED